VDDVLSSAADDWITPEEIAGKVNENAKLVGYNLPALTQAALALKTIRLLLEQGMLVYGELPVLGSDMKFRTSSMPIEDIIRKIGTDLSTHDSWFSATTEGKHRGLEARGRVNERFGWAAPSDNNDIQ
jgi:hypothetical protein